MRRNATALTTAETELTRKTVELFLKGPKPLLRLIVPKASLIVGMEGVYPWTSVATTGRTAGTEPMKQIVQRMIAGEERSIVEVLVCVALGVKTAVMATKTVTITLMKKIVPQKIVKH